MRIYSCRAEKKRVDLVSNEVRVLLHGYHRILGKIRVHIKTETRNMVEYKSNGEHSLAVQISIKSNNEATRF